LEYLVFLAAVLLILALCGLLLFLGARRARGNGVQPGKPRADARSSQGPWRPASRSNTSVAPRASARSRGGAPLTRRGDRDEGLGDALGRWVDSLVAQKRTVEEDADYRVRTHDSLRVLLEDRYGSRVSRSSGSADHEAPERRDAPHAGRPGGRGVTGVKTPWGW
jgi:hypothetical protein